MITPVRPLRPVQCVRPLRLAFVAAFASLAGAAGAHDFERTQVTLTFATDGSFVLDVTNDAAWLEHRLIPFGGDPQRGARQFADRVVLFVDGREVRPTAVEYIGPPLNSRQTPVAGVLATYRMRGRMPLDARILRWYYGLPIDPYPLTIRRADGRIIVEEIAGDAWSGSIDLAGQFRAPRISATAAALAIAALLAIPIAFRVASVRRARPSGRAERRGTA
jgi:hypothetical protein